MRLAILGLTMLAGLACGVRADGPPSIVLDRTACSHCGMLISEPRYAAAYRVQGSPARVFDDIGCLRTALQADGAQGTVRMWFHDASGGEWIDGAEAVLVSAPAIRTPMGGGTIAFMDRAEALAAAAQHRGRIVTVAELGLRKGGS